VSGCGPAAAAAQVRRWARAKRRRHSSRVTGADSTPSWRPRFALLALIWGSSFLSIKVAVDYLAPVDVAFVRVALGASVLLVVLAVTRRALPRGWPVWGHLFVIGLFGNSIPFALLAEGETRISSVLAGIWNASTPLLTLVVATFMLPDERPTPRRVLGLLGGFAGVLVVLGPWRSVGGSELAGQLMCLGAAACYGIAFPYTRRFVAGRPDSGVALSAGQLLWSTVQLGVLTLFVGGSVRHLEADGVAAILALGVLSTGGAYILNYAIVRLAGATTASTVTYVVPLVSTALGIAILSEQLEWNQPFGAALVLGSVAFSEGMIGRR
jgi:drug/metabolite transporter (DMT)-like permease